MMKKVLKTAAFALSMTVIAHGATVPVQNMSAWSLAAEYYGAVHGQEWLMALDESSIASHMLRLHYSPFHFVRLSGGIGAGHAFGSDLDSDKELGLAATAGVGLYLPKLLSFLSLTGGYDWHYLRASEEIKRYLVLPTPVYDDDGNQIGVEESAYQAFDMRGKTSAMQHTPYFGLIFHPCRYVDIEVGGKYNYFVVSKEWTFVERDPTYMVTGSESGGFKDEYSEQFRVYGALTLHERESGAYLAGGASYAVSVENRYKKAYDKGLGKMARVGVWGQIGIIMRDPRGGAKRSSEYSDVYIDMKHRQDGMAEALQRDIERDKERNREEGRDEHDFEEN